MSANKENAEPVLAETERNRREEGRKELKSSYLQITALMRSNKELTKRVQESVNRDVSRKRNCSWGGLQGKNSSS